MFVCFVQLCCVNFSCILIYNIYILSLRMLFGFAYNESRKGVNLDWRG